ncbi:MAG: hypothetical protein U0694_21275 [Anaerolineae bacterium]
MDVLKALNLALSFVLELCMLAALAYWGPRRVLVRLCGMCWGLARHCWPGAVGAAAGTEGCPASVGRAVLGTQGGRVWRGRSGPGRRRTNDAGVDFAVVVLVNIGLNYAWKQG